MLRKWIMFLVIGVLLLGAGGGIAFFLFNREPREHMATDSFRLVILRGDVEDLRLGSTYADAFPKLTSRGTADALFVIGMDQIEAYHWDTQSFILTSEGTKGLLIALEPAEALKDSVRAVNSMRERLGWGDRLDRGLNTKGFLVVVGEEPVYGGIFLEAMSQRPIDYPVIRVSLTPDGKARLNLLPVHVPFFTQDPVAWGSDSRGNEIAREGTSDWQRLPADVRSGFGKHFVTQMATDLRNTIRSTSVRAIMEKSGKIRQKP